MLEIQENLLDYDNRRKDISKHAAFPNLPVSKEES
jgi:hypothetical protein